MQLFSINNIAADVDADAAAAVYLTIIACETNEVCSSVDVMLLCVRLLDVCL